MQYAGTNISKKRRRKNANAPPFCEMADGESSESGHTDAVVDFGITKASQM
jgi:hypothetical protein